MLNLYYLLGKVYNIYIPTLNYTSTSSCVLPFEYLFQLFTQSRQITDFFGVYVIFPSRK